MKIGRALYALPAIAAFAATPAAFGQAQCQSTCWSSYSNCTADTAATACEARRDECLSKCDGRPRGAAVLVPKVTWGFLVFDTVTGRSGVSSNQSSGMAARGLAKEECTKNGGVKCDWQISARGGCVAVAEGDQARGRSAQEKSGGREALDIARHKALHECRDAGGRNCRVVAKTCSFETNQPAAR